MGRPQALRPGIDRGFLRLALVGRGRGATTTATRFWNNWCAGTVAEIEEIDGQITKHAEHWRIERMPAVDRNILRLAVYEMLHTDTPAPVLIDEAIELARRFSGKESVHFVNGVLDAVHRDAGRAPRAPGHGPI